MRKQYSTVSFKGQVVYAGIDVHKRQWTVTIQHCGHAQKSFIMDPDPEKLVEHLKRNYPDAEYRSVYEAGFCGFEAHRALCRLGVKNIVINAADVPTSGKEREKKNTAYHEAGHAIIAHVLPFMDPVQQISIIPSGNALGYTLNPPVEDKFSDYKNAMKEEIAMCLAGRAAEALVFDDISGGASGDIKRATAVAKKMVTIYGMSDVLGTVHLGNPHGDDEVFLGRDFNASQAYSEQTAALIDSEIKKIIDEAYAGDIIGIFDPGIFAIGDNAWVDKMVFGQGEGGKMRRGFVAVETVGTVIDTPETYKDVKGLVTADYQKYLEEKWVKSLRKKYKVKIDKSVLKTVNNHD